MTDTVDISATPNTERGTVLVLFALLLVGTFGMIGVVVDGGRLRLTKQQMDAGAEGAALEGVRFKDRDGDIARRLRATTLAALQWDDDLNPNNGDVIGLGAGTLPIVTNADPLGGDLVVAQPPAARAWKPAIQLQQNLANTTHGDLVAGVYIPSAPPLEDDAFQRLDFAPTTAGSTAANLAAAPAFLVRLRRTGARLALDRQPGESSAGPPFEWLWARGGAWQEPGDTGTAQSRGDGLTIRATAIASTERALAVSATSNAGPLLATFALLGDPSSAWQATTTGNSLTFDIETNGVLSIANNEQGVALATPARVVGAAAQPAPAALTSTPPTSLIVPVYAAITSQRRVFGFTLATATINGATLTVTRLPSTVLSTGASSVSTQALDARVALANTPALRSLHIAFTAPVLAPVLRR